MDEGFYNRVSGERISSRQIDELIGLARGIIADGVLSQGEVEFLQKWLAANVAISDQPVIKTLYIRINEVLNDNVLDREECTELFDALNSLSSGDFEHGEVLKSSTLPLNIPQPDLTFPDQLYCFTGTFSFGQRKHCEKAVTDRGGSCAGLSQKTQFLIVGTYATDSWKHSSFGNKIIKASEWREKGLPISIVSEQHWVKFL